MKGVVAAGHPLTAEAGAQRPARRRQRGRRGAGRHDRPSFVAEPQLTGLGAGGYMLVAEPGARAGAAGLLRRRARRRAPTRRRARRSSPPRCPSATPSQVFHVGAASCGVYGTPAGICEAHRRYATLPLADLVAPAAGARARGRRGQRPAGLHLRPARADHRDDAGGAREVLDRRPRRARGRRARRPRARRRRSSGSAPRARRRSTRGDIGAAACARVARARRHADGGGPRGLRGDRARADPRRLPRPRRLHQPAAVGRRDPDRLRARAARPRARRRRARRGSSPRWSRRTSARTPEFLEGLDRARLPRRVHGARSSARPRTSPCSTATAARAR